MDFNQLCQLYEAKNEKPGQRYKSAVERPGPAGMVSGPIGKDGAFEKSKPLDRWEYDKDVAEKDTGIAEIAKVKGRLRKVFSLLYNDKDFHKRIKKILVTFNKSRESWSDEDERNLEKLNNAVAKRAGEVTDFRNQVDTIKRNFERVDGLKNNLTELEGQLDILKQGMKDESNPNLKKNLKDEIKDTQDDIKNLKNEISTTEKNATSLGALKGLEAKLQSAEGDYQEAIEEYEELQSKIERITLNNVKASEKAERGIKFAIMHGARELAHDIKQRDDVELNDLSQLNWDKMPSSLQEKLSMLEALSEEGGDNPIVDFFERVKRSFDEAFDEFRPNHLDKNVNISSIKTFEHLPAYVFSKFWNNVAGYGKSKDAVDLGTDADIASKNEAAAKLLDRLKETQNRVSWNIPDNKHEMLELVYKLPTTDKRKDEYAEMIKGRWQQGKTEQSKISNRLADRIRKDLKIADAVVAESKFDKIASQILTECDFNEDDYKVDVLEFLHYKKK